MQQYEMLQRIDSLETRLYQLNQQSEILNKILKGEEVDVSNIPDVPKETVNEPTNSAPQAPATVARTNNPESGGGTKLKILKPAEINPKNYNFYLPLKGVISDSFNLERKHLAVDIAAKRKEAVKSVQRGTVIFSDWTPGGGHTLVIQHPNEFVSVYKHNAVLLKKEGTFVKAGDAIALVGNTGELTSGPHLHFELWSKGIAVNPQKYINF